MAPIARPFCLTMLLAACDAAFSPQISRKRNQWIRIGMSLTKSKRVHVPE